MTKWNESGFRPPLCTYRLNWDRRTSWGWWDDWDDTVLRTQDTQLYVSFRFSSYTEAITALCRVEACINEIRTWMKNNKLQLNADKTEYLIVASPNILPEITLRPINNSGIKIEPSVSSKNLGVMFDKHLNMCEHVNQICRKTQFLLKKIGDIRNCLSIATTEILIHAYLRDISTWLLQLSFVWLA